MSKIGKQPVLILTEAKVTLEKDQVLVQGPWGEVKVAILDGIKVEKEENILKVSRWREDKKTRANHGTVRSLLANAVKGVIEGWEKQLEVVGTGYKVDLHDNQLVLTLGFSHPVKIAIPEDLRVSTEENKIKVQGCNRQKVGLFSATLRKISPPDAYQGKGIRYSDEEIKLKPGKIAKAGAA